jgi:hypothetical protein
MRVKRRRGMEKKEDSFVVFADKSIELFTSVLALPREERQKLAASLPPEASEFLVWVGEIWVEAYDEVKKLGYLSDGDPHAPLC